MLYHVKRQNGKPRWIGTACPVAGTRLVDSQEDARKFPNKAVAESIVHQMNKTANGAKFVAIPLTD